MEQKTIYTVQGWSLSTILTIVFVILKLTGTIDWSWVWVLAPLWISAALYLTIIIFVFVIVALAAAIVASAKKS